MTLHPAREKTALPAEKKVHKPDQGQGWVPPSMMI
jgi:hypothetical protein